MLCILMLRTLQPVNYFIRQHYHHRSKIQTPVAMTKSAFVGGALSFKGDKKKSKKKNKKSKHKQEGDSREKKKDEVNESTSVAHLSEDDEELTEAERKALKFKREFQRKESEKIALKSHRERVEELNEKLGSLTELNDIPRVSAAGNG
jgi:protein FAM32A